MSEKIQQNNVIHQGKINLAKEPKGLNYVLFYDGKAKIVQKTISRIEI